MDERYHVTEGIAEPLRTKLEVALRELEHLRDRGHEAEQYPDEKTYAITPMEVWEHANDGAKALINAIALINPKG
ncbi:hypothetical protein ABTZ99_13520 [Actinosynnema sp. NPDC002837]